MVRRKTFWKHSVFATFFVFVVMGLISMISQIKLFDAFNPIEETFSDIEITDIVFSQIRPDPVPDTNIVLINIGYLSRGQIARQLQIVNKYKPLAVGFDMFFFNQKEDTLSDQYLADQIHQVKNMVMVTRLERDDHGGFTKLKVSHPLFAHDVGSGFANLNTEADIQQDFKTCRKFPVTRKIGENNYRAFALELAKFKSPQNVENLLSRQNSFENINYRGNIADMFQTTNYNASFYALDASSVLEEDFDPSVIKGKIVLFGFLGEHFGDTSWDDRFYTPLNKKYAGKTNPDMYGVVIHANIISMILHKDFINEFSDMDHAGLIMAFFICLLNIVVFSLIHHRLTKYYDLLTKTIQVIEVILILYISILALNYLQLKLGLTLTITAIVLSGDLLEIYFSLIIRILRRTYLLFNHTKRLLPIYIRRIRSHIIPVIEKE